MLHRSHHRTEHITYIHLYHLFSCSFTRIFQFYSHVYRIIGLIGSLIRHSFHIIKLSIAQSVAECPHRSTAGKDIISPRIIIASRLFIITFISRQMIIIYRQMSGALRKGKDQFAGRIDSAEQYICDGITFLLPGIPLCYHCRDMFFNPRYCKRLSTHQHYHNRLPSTVHFPNQFFLSTS